MHGIQQMSETIGKKKIYTTNQKHILIGDGKANCWPNIPTEEVLLCLSEVLNKSLRSISRNRLDIYLLL